MLRKLTTAANRLFGSEIPLSCVDLNVPRKVSLTCRIAHSANQRTVDDRFQNNHHLLLHMTSTSCQSGENGVRKFQNQVSIKIAFSSDGYRQRSKSTEFQFLQSAAVCTPVFQQSMGHLCRQHLKQDIVLINCVKSRVLNNYESGKRPVQLT